RYLPRCASTSAGCTSWPVLLDQWFLVYVTTAAMSVSDSCFHDGMALRPLSTTCSCLVLSASFTIGEPSSGRIGPAPLPLGWWQAWQFAAYTFSPRVTMSVSVQTLDGSSALAAMTFFCWVAQEIGRAHV